MTDMSQGYKALQQVDMALGLYYTKVQGLGYKRVRGGDNEYPWSVLVHPSILGLVVKHHWRFYRGMCEHVCQDLGVGELPQGGLLKDYDPDLLKDELDVSVPERDDEGYDLGFVSGFYGE